MSTVEELLQQGITEKRTPCVALYVRRKEKERSLFAGRHTYEDDAPVLQKDDLFDLASMTKVVSTTTLTMLRIQEHKLELDAPMTDYLPQRSLNDRFTPTIRQLLAHCAGFPPGVPFHREQANVRDREQQKALIANVPLAYEPATQTAYSDIGFMILGIILENLDGQRNLAQQFDRDVAQPLGLRNTRFCPDDDRKARCVPTELIPDSTPPQPFQGVVHDENARWHQGIAGHAGLFSTLQDLALFSQMITRAPGSFIDPALLRLFTRPAGLVPHSTRCLGWVTHSPLAPLTTMGHDCLAPDLISPSAFGHTGFTGTAVWIDPVQQTTVILLSNAVHPHREAKARFFPWRDELHAAALREC